AFQEYYVKTSERRFELSSAPKPEALVQTSQKGLTIFFPFETCDLILRKDSFLEVGLAPLILKLGHHNIRRLGKIKFNVLPVLFVRCVVKVVCQALSTV